MKQKDKRRFLAFEMRCYRDLLNVRWQEKVTHRPAESARLRGVIISPDISFKQHISSEVSNVSSMLVWAIRQTRCVRRTL